MPEHCLACGAPVTDGASCQDRFDQALALEFTDAAYGAVHHLTVPAYMLQHNRYSHAGWLGARSLLARFLAGDIDPQRARREHLDGGPSITRGERFTRFGEIRWSRTIADLAFDDPHRYRSDVESWARSVVDDSASVAREALA